MGHPRRIEREKNNLRLQGAGNPTTRCESRDPGFGESHVSQKKRDMGHPTLDMGRTHSRHGVPALDMGAG